jgi:hypothetical protein
MKHGLSRTLAMLALGLVGTGTAAGGVTPSKPSSRLTIYETSSTTAFEYDVRDKGRLGTHRETYERVWANATKNCDMRGGYMSDYHDGFKRSYFDTREGAVRMNAYATCNMPYPDFDRRNEGDALPVATLVTGTGIHPSTGLAQAGGRPFDAYLSVRDLVYRTCLDQDRRVRFMSTAITPRPDGSRLVEARFACNAGMTASNQSD